MEWTQNRKWFTIALIGVLAPVSLLTAFKITGIIPESQTPETMVVDAVGTNVTRPSQLTTFARWVENNYSDGVTFVALKVAIGTYHVGDPSYKPYDWLNLKIVATANTTQGFIHSMVIRFVRADVQSRINILTDSLLLIAYNLSIEKVKDRPITDASYITTVALGKPNNCNLTSCIDWVFTDARNQNHTLTITLETTIYNGTAYKKMALPIQTGVLIP